MKNNDWINYHADLASRGLNSAKHNGFVFVGSTNVYREIIRRIILSLSPNNLLDVCCGTGDVTSQLIDLIDVDGVEAVEDSCDIAKNNGLNIYHTEFQKLETDKKYDCIICIEAITLLDDPKELFDFFHRISKAQSSLVIAFVNRDSIVRKVFNYIFKKNHDHKNVDKYALRDIQKLGLENNLNLIQSRFILQFGFGAISWKNLMLMRLSQKACTHIVLVFNHA